MLIDSLKFKLKKPAHDVRFRTFWQQIHIDLMLLLFLLLVSSAGIFILFSASSQNPRIVDYQILHLIFAFGVMFIVAQISPATLQRSAPWLYLIGLVLLIIVLGIGRIGKGGQRWLNLGFMHFQ